MMKKYWVAVSVVAVALVGLIVAQELPDADFNNVTAQGSVPLTLGDGTEKNMCVNFNDGTFNDSLCWVAGVTNRMIADTAGFGILGGNPQMSFYDTDYSSTSTVAGFAINYADPDANDTTFSIVGIINGTLQTPFKFTSVTGAGGTPVFELARTGGSMQMGYTGTAGSQFAFLIGAQGYYFDDDIYIDEASPGGIFLKDSGGSCFKCSLSAASAYTVTNGTTDRSFDANATSCQVNFNFQTSDATVLDSYLTQLRAAVNWVKVSCNWAGGTTPSIDVQVEECDSTGASCSAEHSAVTCNGGGDATTTFTSASAAADAWINLNFANQSGTAGVLTVTVTANDPACELADVLGSVIADLDTLNILGTSTDRTVSCSSATCPTVTP